MRNTTGAHVLTLATTLGALTACAPTTYDASREPAVTVVTTTTVPTGTTLELLERLTSQARELAGVMIADGDARAAVRSIGGVWAAVRTDVQRERPDLVEEFDTNVAKLSDAVQFRRAADADKAARNLDALAAAVGS